MKFVFDSPEEYDKVREAAHDGVLHWMKIRQMCQGKINMNVDGSPTQYTEGYAIENIISHAEVLDAIEKSPRPVYNEDDYEDTNYSIAEGDDYDSHMVAKAFKLRNNEVYLKWKETGSYVFDDM